MSWPDVLSLQLARAPTHSAGNTSWQSYASQLQDYSSRDTTTKKKNWNHKVAAFMVPITQPPPPPSVRGPAMSFTFSQSGDFHLEEDHYFSDTARCVNWLIDDGIEHQTQLFVLNGDLTTYKQTIQERKFWVDAIIRMADHAPVLLVAGNHGKEQEGDLYPLAKLRGKQPIYLCTEPDFLDMGDAVIAVFPYPRKTDFVSGSNNAGMAEAFSTKLEEFNQRFDEHPGAYRLFFGHFGVVGARISSGQPLAGRCAEYPLESLRDLRAQYVGLSHIHLRQQLAPRVWYLGSLSRCDYSEEEAKGYHLVTLNRPDLNADLSDITVTFRESPTRAMTVLKARYENGEFRFATPPDPEQLKDARVKVVVTVPSELHSALSRDEQERLKAQLLAATPGELKVKIERETEEPVDTAPLTQARSAAEKLRAYWAIRGEPEATIQERLLGNLAELETAPLAERA
jgi:DNA repair exonuclease SbcCD nuclease subunit